MTHRWLLLTTLLSVGPLAAEPDLVAPLPGDVYQELLTSSPFTRAIDHTSQLIVTGVAKVDGEDFVTLFDKDTKETRLVGSSETTEQGYRVVEVVPGPLGQLPSIRLAVGAQQVTLRFDDTMSSPILSAKTGGDQRKGGDRRSGGGSGYVPAPKGIMDRYNKLSKDEQAKFQRWSAEYYKKNPKLKGSGDRFPVVEKAMEAARGRGEFPR